MVFRLIIGIGHICCKRAVFTQCSPEQMVSDLSSCLSKQLVDFLVGFFGEAFAAKCNPFSKESLILFLLTEIRKNFAFIKMKR